MFFSRGEEQIIVWLLWIDFPWTAVNAKWHLDLKRSRSNRSKIDILCQTWLWRCKDHREWDFRRKKGAVVIMCHLRFRDKTVKCRFTLKFSSDEKPLQSFEGPLRFSVRRFSRRWTATANRHVANFPISIYGRGELSNETLFRPTGLQASATEQLCTVWLLFF